MKLKNQPPVYLVKNDYSRNEGGFHPRKVVMVQEVDMPKKNGCRTFVEVVSKEIHHSNGEDIYASKARAIANC